MTTEGLDDRRRVSGFNMLVRDRRKVLKAPRVKGTLGCPTLLACLV